MQPHSLQVLEPEITFRNFDAKQTSELPTVCPGGGCKDCRARAEAAEAVENASRTLEIERTQQRQLHAPLRQHGELLLLCSHVDDVLVRVAAGEDRVTLHPHQWRLQQGFAVMVICAPSGEARPLHVVRFFSGQRKHVEGKVRDLAYIVNLVAELTVIPSGINLRQRFTATARKRVPALANMQVCMCMYLCVCARTNMICTVMSSRSEGATPTSGLNEMIKHVASATRFNVCSLILC